MIIEFEDAVRAKAWWLSLGYARPKSICERTAITNHIIVEASETAAERDRQGYFNEERVTPTG